MTRTRSFARSSALFAAASFLVGCSTPRAIADPPPGFAEQLEVAERLEVSEQLEVPATDDLADGS